MAASKVHPQGIADQSSGGAHWPRNHVSQIDTDRCVAVSAPGKVLFAGGFLVLDRQHTGLVFGLNARIHVRVEKWNPEIDALYSSILVRSPQFEDANWCYHRQKTAQNGVLSSDKTFTQFHREGEPYTKSTNVFVATAVQYALTYLSHRNAEVEENLKITILADDDYYSHSQSRVPGSFTKFRVAIRDAHKTGLGSSAALVTSLVAGLLAFFTPDLLQPYTTDHQKTIHNLAQAAHCAAQGKVGSGFDVAAATYGSCLYRRFTPSILEGVGDSLVPGFGERLHQCVADLNPDHRWDVDVSNQAVKIPQSLLLVMCDVDCGSETPGMVKKVLAWRKENSADASLLWAALQQGTEDLCRELTRLSELVGISFDAHKDLGDIVSTIRSLVREMSQKSGVPIEPPVITELLNYCTSLPGVVGGVAPGAGGYDAVALLVKNDAEVVRELQARLEGWKSKSASNTEPTIGKVSLLGVKQEKEGVTAEDPETLSGGNARSSLPRAVGLGRGGKELEANAPSTDQETSKTWCDDRSHTGCTNDSPSSALLPSCDTLEFGSIRGLTDDL